MPTQSYADALVDALYDGLAADDRVSLIGSYVLGLGPQRRLMDRIRKDFGNRIVDPPTAEAGAAATGIGAAMAGMRPFGFIARYGASVFLPNCMPASMRS